MKRLLFLLAAFAALTSGSFAYKPSHPTALPHPSYALPLADFWGIAGAESDMRADAVSPDGHDRGLWQFRDCYDAGRGLVNPFDPVESTDLARKEFVERLAEFGTVELAITGHKRGAGWVRANGVDREYVAKVRGGNK
jgi:hypothetical protein